MATDSVSTAPAIRLPLTGFCGDRRVVRGWTTVADDEFGRKLMCRRWHLSGVGYAVSHHPGGVAGDVDVLHRVVFERYHGLVPVGAEIDHIDRDKLNNTPSNLRAVTRSQNTVNRGRLAKNTSGFTGVFFRPGRPKAWQAKIRAQGKLIRLGSFALASEAAAAVNRAYAEHHPHVPPPNPGC